MRAETDETLLTRQWLRSNQTADKLLRKVTKVNNTPQDFLVTVWTTLPLQVGSRGEERLVTKIEKQRSVGNSQAVELLQSARVLSSCDSVVVINPWAYAPKTAHREYPYFSNFKPAPGAVVVTAATCTLAKNGCLI